LPQALDCLGVRLLATPPANQVGGSFCVYIMIGWHGFARLPPSSWKLLLSLLLFVIDNK